MFSTSRRILMQVLYLLLMLNPDADRRRCFPSPTTVADNCCTLCRLPRMAEPGFCRRVLTPSLLAVEIPHLANADAVPSTTARAKLSRHSHCRSKVRSSGLAMLHASTSTAF